MAAKHYLNPMTTPTHQNDETTHVFNPQKPMPNALNKPQTTNPSTTMNFQEFMTMPFGEALALLVKGAVDEYLDRSGLIAAIADAAKRDNKNEIESLDAKGALDFLNANGYPISKGQLYKETSNGTIPFQKFGSKLHFRKSELLEWAENRLIDGNAVGILAPAETNTRKGGRR